MLWFAVLLCGCAAAPPSPGSSPASAAVPLLETYWRAVEIDGRPVAAQPGTRERHVVLRADGARVTGFTGCNTLTGSFEHSGDRLTFGRLATTRMACLPEAGAAPEWAFVSALERTATYRIDGTSLELRDAAGAARARFAASPR